MDIDNKNTHVNVILLTFLILNPVLIYILSFFIELNKKMISFDFKSNLHFYISIILFLLLGLLIGFMNYICIFFYQTSFLFVLLFQMAVILLMLSSYLLNPAYAKFMDEYSGRTVITLSVLLGNIIFLIIVSTKRRREKYDQKN